MFSASSSLTWAPVGLPDSRSLRKGCIVIPPMLCYLLLKSSKGLSSRPIDSASFGTSPRPQSLCKVAAGQVAAFRGWMSGRHLKLRPVPDGDALLDSEFGGTTTRLMMSVQAFPDAARAFRDVGLRGATVMHLEVLVGAVAKKLRAARPEVGEPGDVLLGRRGGCLVQVDRGHAFSLLAVSHRAFVVR